MIKSEKIKNYIETNLNLLAQDELGYDIYFKGEVDFYDYDWVKRSFTTVDNSPKGIQATPFVLTTNLFKKSRDDKNDFEFRYTIVSLPLEKDRDKIREIYHILGEVLDRERIGGYNVRFVPTNVSFGADFSEGSGFGTKRFEAIFEFEGRATKSFNLEDIELKFGTYEIPITSFKYEHSKTNILNIKGEVDYNQNSIINGNLLVVETILAEDSQELTTLLNKKQKVNMTENITLKVNGEVIIDDTYDFENYALRYDANSDRVVALLYFEYETTKMNIVIDGDTIPIIDFSVSMVTNTDTHSNSLSNVIRNIYLGKAVSYAFNVVENNNFDVLERLYADLMVDTELEPIYNVKIELGNNEYDKRLLLSEIKKDSQGTARNVITLNFLEGSDF